ncbi:hypothetical protein [Nostoc sp. TCL26-01]|uniref:hypothetical protein n=1 Tax=Nostoc sp. TCL26-01 TaxID=2576904 RepID=UPI0015BDF335|nr:hypothetical protein [Nostoc sp. TCL26-01]QLE57403.1 hypothetical protein FD725_18880 [Nostoc sp. TCL26-01]
MTELEILINDLPKIVYCLKLTLGNAQEIMQQVVLINQAQTQLRHIQQAIAQDLNCVSLNSTSVGTLAPSSTTNRLFVPSIWRTEPAITGNVRLIIEKFGNSETEISSNALKSKIDCWIEWGDLLQAIAADILSDAQLINQINLDIHHPSLTTQIKIIENSLKINLAADNSLILQKQIQQLISIDQDLLQAQNQLTYIINTIKNSHRLVTILLAISSFCGQSGFSVEWLDDTHELIISSEFKFQELTDILNDCEIFQNKINSFLLQNQTLKKQAQENLNKKKSPTWLSRITNHNLKTLLKKNPTSQVIHKTLVLASSIAVLGFGSWIIKEQIIQYQQAKINIDPEINAVNNFKSALKLGMEASFIAQNPPHNLTIWQQAAIKWQQAINLLETIPENTSVSSKAQEKIIRYRRNYIAIKERANNEKQASDNLTAAEKLATEASFFLETSPNSLLVWQQAKDRWQQAIKLLESIPKNSSVYYQAQATLPKYKTHYTALNAIIQNREQAN